MKQPSECKCTMVGAKITKLTSGNTAGRVDRWCLTSGLAGNGKVPDGSWATSRVCCKATATEGTIISKGHRARRVLCACQAKVFRCSETQSQRSNIDSNRGADE